MRFRASLSPSSVFSRFVASIASLGNVAWMRLDHTDVKFTVIPEHGTQVWAVLSPDTIFESYSVQSAAEQINLEVPLEPLLSALRAASPSNNAANAGSNTQQASMRLTKKQGRPVLCVSLVNKSYGPAPSAGLSVSQSRENSTASGSYNPRERETRISLDVPVRLLPPERVAGLHEPRCRDPEVHIMLPNLQQLKAVSDRFTKLAGVAPAGSHRALAARLTLSATMHGTLRLGLRTDTASVASVWRNLNNPDLDPAQAGAEHVAQHPSTRMRAVPERPYVDENDEDEDDNEDDTFHVNGFTGQRARGWATVRVDARDWSKVLSVGRLACTRVIACFCHQHAMILYVYLPNDESDESVLTYYIPSHRT